MPTDTQPPEPAGAIDPALAPASICHDQALAAPPPDVQALLAVEDCALPWYFDAQRAQACQRLQRDWPRLWGLAPAPE